MTTAIRTLETADLAFRDDDRVFQVHKDIQYAIRLGSGELSKPMDTMQQARMALFQSVMMAQDDAAYEDAEVVTREVVTMTSYTDWQSPSTPPSPHS